MSALFFIRCYVELVCQTIWINTVKQPEKKRRKSSKGANLGAVIYFLLFYILTIKNFQVR